MPQVAPFWQVRLRTEQWQGVDTPAAEALIDRVQFNDQGLVPAVVQEATSHAVLMLAWMDVEALRRTLASGVATYWSRSRQEYWVKGKTSGNTQHVRDLKLDCDGDTVLLTVDQVGPACHTGSATCFDAVAPDASASS